MNHTIKGIIIVVVITSMLFVGATSMFPIMQSSFASKKSDFKGAERDPNTNTNTNINTNSATSDSDSTATADNTNNINNTATASNSQEQSACAVAVTCPEGSTTVTPPTPPTATCVPSTVGGFTATLQADGTCTASLPAGSTDSQLAAFEDACFSSTPTPHTVAVNIRDNSATCTFPSTPPT